MRSGKIVRQARLAVMAGIHMDERDLINPYKNEFAASVNAEICAELWDRAFKTAYAEAEAERNEEHHAQEDPDY